MASPVGSNHIRPASSSLAAFANLQPRHLPQNRELQIMKMLDRRALTHERVDCLEELIACEWVTHHFDKETAE